MLYAFEYLIKQIRSYILADRTLTPIDYRNLKLPHEPIRPPSLS